MGKRVREMIMYIIYIYHEHERWTVLVSKKEESVRHLSGREE